MSRSRIWGKRRNRSNGSTTFLRVNGRVLWSLRHLLDSHSHLLQFPLLLLLLPIHIQITMSLRIGSQRLSAVLRVQRTSAPQTLRRSYASTATSNLPEAKSSVTDSQPERCCPPNTRPSHRLRNHPPRKLAAAIHGPNLRPSTSHVPQGPRMLPVRCGKQEILGLHSWNRGQLAGPLRRADESHYLRTVTNACPRKQPILQPMDWRFEPAARGSFLSTALSTAAPWDR